MFFCGFFFWFVCFVFSLRPFGREILKAAHADQVGPERGHTRPTVGPGPDVPNTETEDLQNGRERGA